MHDQVRIEDVRQGELECWRLSTDSSEVLIARQGAQVLEYRVHAQPRPLIWLSPQAAFANGQAVRGGIPVCWPWFGDLQRNPPSLQAQWSLPSPPAHGLVRQLPWQRLEASADADLRLRAPSLEGFAAELTLELKLEGEALTIRLVNHNTGQQPLAISQALHSYFSVSDIRQVSLAGLDHARCLDTLDGWQQRRPPQAHPFRAETDLVYLDVPSQVQIIDPAWQRRLVIDSFGSASAVVWNPWIEKAKRLSQFGDHDWTGMLCIETARLLDDMLWLAPGEQQHMGLRLQAYPLD